MGIDEVKNRVPGNTDVKEHIAHVFDEVIPKITKANVKINVIGMGDSAPDMVQYLKSNWKKWEKNVQAVATATAFLPIMDDTGEDHDFRGFWGDVSSSFSSILLIPLPVRFVLH